MFSRWIRFLILAALVTVLMYPYGYAFAQGGSGATGSSDTLSTVVVTVGRVAEQLREVTSNVTVISGEDIELSAADDLAQLMRQQGFWLVDYGATQYLQIRGMHSTGTTQDRAVVLVLVNGRRTGVTEINQVATANVERIEIVRGPAAVQYGSSAMGGVINVITKRGQENTFTATLETGLGSFGLNKDAFSFNGGYQNFDFSGSYSYIEKDAFTVSKKIGGLRWPHTSSLDKSARVEIGYTFNGLHRIGFNYNYFQSRHEWPSYSYNYRAYRQALANGMINPPDNFPEDLYCFDVNTYGLTYDGSTENNAFDWSLFYSKTENKRTTPTSGDYSTQNVTNGGFSVGYNSNFIDVDLGIDFIKYDIDGMYDGKSISKDLGVYLTSKIKPFGESLYISIGGRYDKFDLDPRNGGPDDMEPMSKTTFNPSIGLSYLPLEWLKLRANYSKGFRMLSVYELTPSIWYMADPSLKPEESKTLEFGIEADYKFVSASLTYFTTDWKNKIIGLSSPPGSIRPYWWTNLKDSTIAGYELAANADLGQAFDLGFEIVPYVSFTYLSKRVNKDPVNRVWDRSSMLQNTPRWTLAYGLTLRHPGLDFQFNANAAHLGDMVTSSPPVYKGSQFTALDLSFEKGLLEFGTNGDRGKLKLRVEAKNVLDSKNELWYNYPGPGRNFYVGLKYVY
jgi:vitamin B12 transporter